MINPQKTRPFWGQVLKILGIDTLLVVLGALILGDIYQISNFYFISSAILLIIAAIPIVSEVGSNAKIAGKAIKNGQKVNPMLKEKQAIYQRDAQITYLYGAAGVITFILSFVTTLLVK
jgi:multisubunit Na+/H+ antiporter MnhE subunit